MSEGTTEPVAKPPVEEKVRERLGIDDSGQLAEVIAKVMASGGRPLTKAKVWNPDTGICVVDAEAIKGTPGTESPPETIKEYEKTYAGLKDIRKWTMRGKAGKETDLTESEFAELRIALKKGYLVSGAGRYKTFTEGNCTFYAGVTIGMLVDKKLVPAGIDVELGTASYKKYAHSFVVLGRVGEFAKPGTWGKGCLVIDQWYANQKNTSPGTLPVKSVSDPESLYYDEGYLTYLRGAISLQAEVDFSPSVLSGYKS